MRRVAIALLALLVGCASARDATPDASALDAGVDATDAYVADGCVAAPETCNDLDDDCDGHADEDFTGKDGPCSVGMGACTATGTYRCTATGDDIACDATAGTAVAESCNAVDDDCDGMTDEDFALGTACDGADADACGEGTIVCDGAGAATCSDATADSVELCNGVDDDCRNGIDDPFPVGQACSKGLGMCARAGQLVCDAAGTGTTCNATPGAPSAETCGNALDEDCNGADATCPTNDRPAGAIDISAGGTFTVDLATANDDNWEPSSLPELDCGDMGGRDVFYTFTLPAEEVVYFDTFGSSFDSVVRVFAGSCTSLGAVKACADDSCATTRSQGAVDLLAGTYCLVVDQFSSAATSGAASLTFKRGGRAGTLIAGSGTKTGSTTGLADLSVASCEPNTHQPEAAFAFLSCPTATTLVSASTCTGTAFDTILYMRSGSATSADIACSDDAPSCGPSGFQSRITNKAVSGANLQWIILDGFGQTGNGSYTLTYAIQ